jgi:hypothetical protein
MRARVLVITTVATLIVSQLRATTITVTSTNDSGPGSFRAALASAANNDVINFSVPAPSSVILTGGELRVTNSVTILGPGATNLMINGNAASRVFHIGQSNLVSISGLTITNGAAGNAAPGGAGIYNDHATLAVSNCVVTGNSAGNDGGGGIYNDHGALMINNCVISGNSAGSGGGVENDGMYSGSATLNISNSTISSNSAGYGGAISNSGSGTSGAGASAQITNCTISGNSASTWGGAVFNWGVYGDANLVVANTTLNNNSSSGSGGDIYNGGSGGTGIVEIANTILNAGASGQNITNDTGTVTSYGYNLSSDDAGGDGTTAPGGLLNAPGDQRNTNPLLDPAGLKNNGGPTPTIALQNGSPAIDAGNPTFTPPPYFDQRGPGFPRVVNGRIDIGAFEFNPLLISAAQRVGNDLRLTLTGVLPGYNYEVQARTNLTFGTWGSLPGSISGNAGTLPTTITNAFGTPQQFYRVYQLP